MSESPRLTPHVRLQRVEAVVNAASGSVGPGAAAQLKTIVSDFGLDLSVAEPAPGGIPEAVKAAMASHPDLVIVLAGDGTASLAASLAGPDGPLVAPLPGGTMNMLPHALYGQKPWPVALTEALTDGVERIVPGGEVNGQSFYVAAILGSPALWAEAREDLRARKLKQAILRARRALLQTFSGRLKFRLEQGEVRKAEALTLMSPLVSRGMTEETALEAAVLDVHTTGEALRLGMRALMGEVGVGVGRDFGGWRDDPSVTIERVLTGRAWARGRIPAILDGEPTRLPKGVAFTFLPKAFRALAPAPAVAP